MIKKKTQKSFDDKISKLSRKTKENITASMNSFDRFCMEVYDGKKSLEIFEELNLLKNSQHQEALREVLQNWIDWQYENGNLTSSVQHINILTFQF